MLTKINSSQSRPFEMRTLGKHTPLLQSHKKSSSVEFLSNNTFKFTRSIHGFSVFFSFFFSFFNYYYQGKTPHKIDWRVKNWQKAIITKHRNKNIKILCTDIPAHKIIRIMVIGVLDLTGWCNLIRQKKDIIPAFTQFTFIFQKHEVLI